MKGYEFDTPCLLQKIKMINLNALAIPYESGLLFGNM
jgi:hypothetical protein